MLSEKEIEALKNGAYGVTRDGRKVKYLGENVVGGHFWLEGLEDNKVKVISYDRFDDYYIKRDQSCYDIVGLWENKPEPFNLERALAGEPVKTRDGCKAYVQTKIEQPNELTNYALIGYGFNGNHREFLHWSENGMVLSDDISCDDIIGMWKEPEQVVPSANDLPKPIREFGDLTAVWFIELDDEADIYTPCDSRKGKGWSDWQHNRLNNGCYYAAEEDCKKVCDWLIGR